MATDEKWKGEQRQICAGLWLAVMNSSDPLLQLHFLDQVIGIVKSMIIEEIRVLDPERTVDAFSRAIISALDAELHIERKRRVISLIPTDDWDYRTNIEVLERNYEVECQHVMAILT
ncbi:MAG: hypothetical protein LUP99_05895, partial [Methanomicrobiales archaeon]|nr:hypothetical protein [Methanomicrobiales archaeon]